MVNKPKCNNAFILHELKVYVLTVSHVYQRAYILLLLLRLFTGSGLNTEAWTRGPLYSHSKGTNVGSNFKSSKSVNEI